MNIVMSGLEHSLTPIHLRERLSFTKHQTAQMAEKIYSFPHISGCVLLSTCNRTELYLSCEDEANPGELLCRAAGMEYSQYQQMFITRSGQEAVQHLMEVSAGLCSRIWGEDQIISQVKNAVSIARQAHTTDPVLETLFRFAISAGKEVRTKARLTAVSSSAASMAAALIKEKLGALTHKKAMVIGNGEMGRLAASLLQKEGCDVLVTLRSYRHGETIVPPGCGVVPYDERMQHMNGIDILISATTSPHYTVTADQLSSLSRPPVIAVDLAIPRDIQPEAGNLPGISLYNIDDLGSFPEKRIVPENVSAILQTQMNNFYRWQGYKDCLGSVDSLKQAIIQRLLRGQLGEELSVEEIVELSVSKTVDLLVSGLAERITSENLEKCESKIRLHTN